MSVLEQLRVKNPNRKFYELSDKAFDVFGRILELSVDDEMMDYMVKEAKFPEVRNVYVGSDKKLETFKLKKELEETIYAGMECQFGYCNGLVSNINGFEFHQCSEVFISVTDCLLALIEPHKPLGNDEVYKMEDSFLFYVPAGTALELYPMTGHFSPLRVYEEGYRTVIILSKGTNEPLDNGMDAASLHKDKNLAFAKNKWLYLHEDRMDLVEKGAHLHVVGDNSSIKVL